ncbi:MAG: hypothetical protein ACKVIR_08285 [Candidatus Poseidoniales archaeon]
MARRRLDDNAEVGASAMVIFIGILIASSVISALIISVGGTIFTRAGADAKVSSHGQKGIVNVVILEIWALDTTDEIHIVFDLPFIETPLRDTDFTWILMCLPAGNRGLEFDSGSFEFATTLDGDGLTALPTIEFLPGANYRMIIQLDLCDLEVIEKATLILIIDKGSTHEKVLNIGTAPYVGKDLN